VSERKEPAVTTQVVEPQTKLGQLAVERVHFVARRDAALAVLAARAGAAPPQIREGGVPKLLTAVPYLVGQTAVEALLAEALVALAGEIDALKAQLAKKGSK
jgi:hypothetical protein